MNGKTDPETIAAARHRRRVTTFSAATVLAAFSLAGCADQGPVLVEAGGTVKYQGEPVPGATIAFVADAGGQPVSARTDDAGRFTVTTRGKPGAVAGNYKVAISAIRLKGPVSVNMTTEQILANEEVLLPRKYGNHRTSGLTATVTEDPAQNNFEFDLK